MPRFKVMRRKVYEAYIEATTEEEALVLAEDLTGNSWKLVNDFVLKSKFDQPEPESDQLDEHE